MENRTFDSQSAANEMVRQQHERLRPHWFVIKAQHRETRALDALVQAGFRTFYPTRKGPVTRHGRKFIVEQPLIPNTLFAYAPFKQLNDLKNAVGFLTYSYRREGNEYKILQISDAEMERFIDAVTKMNDDIAYFRPGEVELKKGDRVRIVGGIFDGHEGVLLRAKGRARRMFLINFELLGAIGTHIEPEFIQVLGRAHALRKEKKD